MSKTKFQTGEYYHIYNRGVDKRKVFMGEKDYLRFLRGMREFNNVNPVGSLYGLDYRRSKEKEVGLSIEKKEVGRKKEVGLPIGSPTSGSETEDKEVKLPIGSLTSELTSELSKLIDIICYCLNPNHYHLILKQLTENGISKFMHKLDTGYTKYFNYKYDRSGSLFQGTFKPVHIDTNEYLLWLSGYVNGNVEIHKIAKAENYKWSSYQDYLELRNGTLCNKEVILSQFGNMGEYKNYVNLVIKKSGERKDLEKYFIE